MASASGKGGSWWRLTATSVSTLGAGAVLRAGETLPSPGGRARLTMQADGNLVLYGPAGWVWQSRTSGAGAYLMMQSDGNLVVYGRNGRPLWWSSSFGARAQLVVQDDANLVVYSGTRAPLWWSRR